MPALRSLAAVRVLSVADPDEGRRNQAGRLLGAHSRYRNLTELLAGTPVDAVGVCVPPGSHTEVVVEALAAGRHVLVEKPLAPTLADCDRIIAAAASTGLTAGVGFNYRCHRLVREARNVLRTGVLGPLVLIETSFTNAALHRTGAPEWRSRPDMTSMLEKGVHDFDLWRLLGDSEVTTVIALSLDGHGDSTAGLLGRLENGALCVAGLSSESGAGHIVSLSGRERRLELHLQPPGTLKLVTGGRPRRMVAERLSGLTSRLRGSPATALSARRNDLFASFASEWEEFAAAVKEGRPPAATLEDGRAAVAIAVAATQSLSQGSVAVTPASPPPL